MRDLRASLILAVLTLGVCAVGYPLAIWLIAHGVSPATARGDLVERDGVVVGARNVAQGFKAAPYLWPRPSAVGWDGAATGGSNLSPANPAIAERARELLDRPGMLQEGPVPAEMLLASGSGLDPHVTLGAALYQAPRIAAARAIDQKAIEGLLRQHARSPGGVLTGPPLVNVLEANLALDRAYGRAQLVR